MQSLQYFNQFNWRYIDHSTLGLMMPPLQSFAYDDTFCETVDVDDKQAIVRSWIHHNTIVLGTQDTRLPTVKNGIEYLQSQGHQVIIRNSGGLGVVLDEGILNISLIFNHHYQLSIDDGYTLMYKVVEAMLEPYTTQRIEAKEIVRSYCPGDYDLSIDDKKFAGISQRRIRQGMAVQIYLCVSGSGSQRATLMQQFYQQSGREFANHPTQYPDINPECMASLNELLGTQWTAHDVLHLFLSTLQAHSKHVKMSELTVQEQQIFQQRHVRVNQRNHKLMTTIHQ